jgi:hypothetical protein
MYFENKGMQARITYTRSMTRGQTGAAAATSLAQRSKQGFIAPQRSPSI